MFKDLLAAGEIGGISNLRLIIFFINAICLFSHRLANKITIEYEKNLILYILYDNHTTDNFTNS
jgi:hypothetical protein